MRALSIVCGVAFAAVLAFGAMLLLATGKTFVFAPGAGGSRLGPWALWALVLCLLSLAAAAGAWVVARTLPRRYFQVMWWRDLGIVIAAVAGVVFAVALLWSQVAYGAL